MHHPWNQPPPQEKKFAITINRLILLIESDAPLARKTRAVGAAFRHAYVDTRYLDVDILMKLYLLLLQLLKECMDLSLDQRRKALYAQDIMPMVTLLNFLFSTTYLKARTRGAYVVLAVALMMQYTQILPVVIHVLQNGGHSAYSSWLCAIDMLESVYMLLRSGQDIGTYSGQQGMFDLLRKQLASTIPLVRAISESSDEKLRRAPDLHRERAAMLLEVLV
jgi:hypothetical protein